MMLLTVLLLAAVNPAAGDPAAEAVRAHADGMKLVASHPPQLRAALPLLERAVALEPQNSDYLGDLAGACFQLADVEKSYSMATRGRNLMEQTVALNPRDVKARDGLMQFYGIAPWPLGDADKAQEEAAAIGRVDPKLGAEEELKLAKIFEKKGRRQRAEACYRAAAALGHP